MKRLKVIEGGAKPKSYSLAAGSPAEPVTCPVCDGRTLMPVKSGMVTFDGNNFEGGTDEMICAQCLTEGRLTTVL